MKHSLTLRSNMIFFYLSFFTAGTQNILTQLFYKSNYPEYKEVLLPLTLISGAIAYILGIYFSNKLLRASGQLIKLFLPLNVITFIFLFVVRQGGLYIFFYIIACFCCNFVFNTCDHYFLKRYPDEITRHVKAMLAFQMSAYILSPLFFSINSGNIFLCIGTSLLLAVIAGLFSLKGSHLDESPRQAIDMDTTVSIAAIAPSQKLFIIYVIIYLSVVSIATSMLAYLISDYYRLQNYTLVTGVLLMLMSAFAGIGAIIYKNPRNKPNPTKDHNSLNPMLFNSNMHFGIIVVTIIMTLLLFLRLFTGLIYLSIILCVMGFGYGLFLSCTRKFASTVSIITGEKKLLSVYNNLQSIALLVGYALSAAVWKAAELFSLSYYPFLIICVLIMLVLEIPIILAFIWINNDTNDIITKKFGKDDKF